MLLNISGPVSVIPLSVSRGTHSFMASAHADGSEYVEYRAVSLNMINAHAGVSKMPSAIM
ncbi:hypothetical protein CHCC20375_3413 [Bacillus licheniformis]|nr:hypothetical protein CHCC20375_3413 [Bacillus licheniformis]